MQTLQLRDAKASLSAVVMSAQNGQPTIITRHGLPTAMIVSIEDGRRLFPTTKPSLVAHLMAMPEAIQTERDSSPLRSIDL
jgi:antitoxin Phd